MHKRIHKVAVLGAGTMGARIAAHLANAGVPCYLLDIVPPDAAAGGADRTKRNAIAAAGLEATKTPKHATRFDFFAASSTAAIMASLIIGSAPLAELPGAIYRG